MWRLATQIILIIPSIFLCSFMASEIKPSAEIQAIVMNLWNVIREVAQANTATQTENKAFAQKYHTLNEQMQQEHERHAKLQAYTEHLQTELKQWQHDHEALQGEQSEHRILTRQHEETIQELRSLYSEQEAVLSARIEENTALREQLAKLQDEAKAEREQFLSASEALKHDLAQSRQQALNVATEVDEAKAELDDLRTERNTLFEENEQLRWRLQALEKQVEEDQQVMERKVEEARLHSGEMTMQLEESKRFASESNERISVLTEERTQLRTALEKAEQESQTWQQIAEEQTQRITELQDAEKVLTEQLTQNLTEQLTQEFEQKLAHDLEQARQEASSNLSSELASAKNRYETAIENLKTQLHETRLQHQQMLDAHAEDTEQQRTALAEEIALLQAKNREQAEILEVEQRRTQDLERLAEQSIHITANEREALTATVKSLLERVESALEAM